MSALPNPLTWTGFVIFCVIFRGLLIQVGNVLYHPWKYVIYRINYSFCPSSLSRRAECGNCWAWANSQRVCFPGMKFCTHQPHPGQLQPPSDAALWVSCHKSHNHLSIFSQLEHQGFFSIFCVVFWWRNCTAAFPGAQPPLCFWYCEPKDGHKIFSRGGFKLEEG